MEQTTAIQPLQQRRQAKVLLQAEKYKCLPDHPMKEKVEGRTNNRIKRSSFTHEVKKLHKDYPAVLTIPTLPLSKQDFTNLCENNASEIQIKTTIPQLDQGKELDASIRRSLALVNIAEKLSTTDMDTRLYRWFSNQGNYRRRRWYHHPVSQWCNTDCQFCHREALHHL